MKFRVPAVWAVSHTFTVEAKTQEEANAKILNAAAGYEELPKGRYVEDTLYVDEDALKKMSS